MDIYRVALFGHRDLDAHEKVERKLFPILTELIRTKSFVEFYIGRDGEFDIFTASLIKRFQRNTENTNSEIILVLPYPKKDIEFYEQYYDGVIITDQIIKNASKESNYTTKPLDDRTMRSFYLLCRTPKRRFTRCTEICTKAQKAYHQFSYGFYLKFYFLFTMEMIPLHKLLPTTENRIGTLLKKEDEPMKERKREDAPIEEFPSINSPHIAKPISDPPVPNRAHTEMLQAEGLDVLTENEKAKLYFNKDAIL